jgi:hypothetical protein
LYGRKEKLIQGLENLKERDHLEAVGVDGRIILARILMKYIGREFKLDSCCS